MHKTLDTQYVYYELYDDLLIGTFKKNPRLNLEMAKEIVKVRQEFTGPRPVVGLIFNQGVVSLDKKARDYLASAEGVRGFKAAAFILDSPFSSFLVNFFVTVTKPKIPVKMFSKKEAALKWLEQFRK
jgi:hypothetical protein